MPQDQFKNSPDPKKGGSRIGGGRGYQSVPGARLQFMWGRLFFRGYETGLGFHTYETGMKPV